MINHVTNYFRNNVTEYLDKDLYKSLEKPLETQSRIAKAYLENKHALGQVTAILCTRKGALRVCAIKNSEISRSVIAYHFFNQLKLGQEKLSQLFSDKPEILLSIFKRQLSELNDFMIGRHFEKLPINDSKTNSTDNDFKIIIYKKIHHLVYKINELNFQLHKQFTPCHIPRKVTEYFPKLVSRQLSVQVIKSIFSFILDSDDRIAFCNALPLSNKWELLKVCPDDYCRALSRKINTISDTVISECPYLDVDFLTRSLSLLNLNKEALKEVHNKFDKFTALNSIRVSGDVPSQFISDHLVKIVNSTQKSNAVFSNSKVKDSDILFITSKFEELDVSGTKIDGKCLANQSMKDLKKLRLSSCSELKESELANASMVTLDDLDLSNNKHLEGSCLSYPLFKPVKKLKLDDCTHIKNFETLACTAMENLSVNRTLFTGTALSNKRFKSLKVLSAIDCVMMTDDNALKLTSKELEYADFSGTRLSGVFLIEPAYQKLTHFFMSHCVNLRDDYVQWISKVKVLDLSNTKIKGSGLIKFENLEELNLSGCENLNEDLLSNLKSQKLKKLNVSTTKITGKFFSAPFLKTVVDLNIAHCKNVKDDAISTLSCKNLKIFDLTNTAIDGFVLKEKLFETVEDLTLNHTAVTDSTLKLLPSKNLKRLGISQTKLLGHFLRQPAFHDLRLLDARYSYNFKNYTIPTHMEGVVLRDSTSNNEWESV